MKSLEDQEESNSASSPLRYVLWGVALWLAVCATILLSGGNSKFIYIDF